MNIKQKISLLSSILRLSAQEYRRQKEQQTRLAEEKEAEKNIKKL